jgi:hypothetical protein
MEEHWVTLAKELWEENQKRSKRVDESINSLLLFVRPVFSSEDP